MPYQNHCPACRKVGFVRFEHVITGRGASREFYCGACEHLWTVVDTLDVVVPAPPETRRKPRTRLFRAKRRP